MGGLGSVEVVVAVVEVVVAVVEVDFVDIVVAVVEIVVVITSTHLWAREVDLLRSLPQLVQDVVLSAKNKHHFFNTFQ